MASEMLTSTDLVWRSSSVKCCMFCASDVAAMHPTLDPVACHAELARLAAVGGVRSRLVVLPSLIQSQDTDATLAMYSFRRRTEMESLYHAMTIDTLQLLHSHAIDDVERSLRDGTACHSVGLSGVEARAQSNKRYDTETAWLPHAESLTRTLGAMILTDNWCCVYVGGCVLYSSNC